MAKSRKPARKASAKRKPATPAQPRGRGRPTDYRPEYCAAVVDLGREGKSRAQIAAALDVDRDTLANWEKARPEFFGAMKRAHDLALAWWEDQGQKGIWSDYQGRTLNAAAYALQMRNRFSDEYGRPEAVVDLNVSVQRETIARKLDRVAKPRAA